MIKTGGNNVINSNQNINTILRRVSRLATIAVVLSTIGLTAILWANAVDGAPFTVQLLGVPLGAAIGIGLTALVSRVDA